MKDINQLTSSWREKNQTNQNPPTQPAPNAVAPVSTNQPPAAPKPMAAASTLQGDEFNRNLKDVLRPYSVEQRKHIMAFFGKMQENFSTQFTHMYGSEPDDEFAAFAAELSLEDVERIVHHLRERLVAGKEWPPALALLSMLKDLPLNNEILEARHRILIKKEPQTRVEKYIFNRKNSYLRSLSERNLAEEFKVLYINAYQEVQNNLDQTLDQREKDVEQNVLKVKQTDTDREVARRAELGIRPGGQVGALLNRIDQLRTSEVKPMENATDKSQQKIEREQQALMKQILTQTSGDNENL
ncbi:hypothetical protein ACODM8_17655 [Vibrio ostreicida]|uniref:Uncharacterized protein n=1 Tax=Vibrio ostreicida TaxID=526588 RepID=A0ABT8C134_9VIBR|nr:hypothetical protein [Vibrio ostreicida]MDN3612053.1 hypothetical protein [Vibrio ostreicida]NPD08775.1 hypothetical protein [Vibrio ostreicida]